MTIQEIIGKTVERIESAPNSYRATCTELELRYVAPAGSPEHQETVNYIANRLPPDPNASNNVRKIWNWHDSHSREEVLAALKAMA